MAKRVFLHIGTMKSATTYIQDLCALNAKTLREQGVLWAPSAFTAMHDLLDSGGDRPAVKGTWEPLNALIRAHDGDVLLSNELLAAIKTDRVGALIEAFKPAEVQVIITARDLARVIPSQWQTMTRNRHTVTWESFVDAAKSRVNRPGGTGAQFWRKQDLAGILSRWSQYVPVEQITVVTVPAKGSPSSLLPERFGSVIGVDLAALPQPGQSNPALGGPSAELLRRLNLRTKDWDLHHYQLAFKNATARFVLEPRAKQEPKVSLSTKDMDWVRRRSERMIAATRASGVRVVGDLDELLPTIEVPKKPVDPGSLSDTEMLEVAEYTIVGLAKMLAEIRVEFRHLADAFARVDPIDTEGDEWRQFLESEAGRDDGTLPGNRKGRFFVWRATHRQPEQDLRGMEAIESESREQADSRD